jgi:hypothetical protein
MEMLMTTFKEQHREFQELVREVLLVRKHNLAFKPGDRQDTILMFAEAALVLTAMERFLRIILSGEATDQDTLANLLQKATSKRLDLIRFHASTDRDDAIRRIADVRNTLLHGNYEQARQRAGCANVLEYFQKQFTPEIEKLFELLDGMAKQIDPETGRRRE